MRLLLDWLWYGGWRWFRPGKCYFCGQWTLVFRKACSGAVNECEYCWLSK